MSKVILAYPNFIKFESEENIKTLASKKFPEMELVKFDYINERYNPIRGDVQAIILIAYGRVVPKEAQKRVIELCKENDIPVYIPCVHDLFPSETYHWTIERVNPFQKGVTTLEQMSPEDIEGMEKTGLIPCVTIPM